MGHKSKFTFPVPGRPSKQQTPTVSMPTPLSKAQKILGTGGINIDSPALMKEPTRSWDTGSNGGISISVSESSASQHANDNGLGVLDENEEDRTGTSYGRGMWEQESDVIPRQLRHAHAPSGKGLTPKKSAVTIGADYRDTMTDDTFVRRRESSSTIWTHYESAKMPLAISQQTSNSAMAKGLPTKISSLLDMDGAMAGDQQKKKKHSRLDFSRLRSKNRKDSTADNTSLSPPILGNSYVMKSPSLMSQSFTELDSPTRSSVSKHETNQKSSRRFTKSTQSDQREIRTPDLTRPRGPKDNAGLHQLYDHYEQMSFRDSPTMNEEEEEEEEQKGEEEDSIPNFLEPRTYEQPSGVPTRDIAKPFPLSNTMVSKYNAGWKHPREASQDSKTTATRSDTPNTVQIRPNSNNDYATSVSSRHTRTSKASPSLRSTLDSDRQQNSVLSLSDSDSDEDGLLDPGPIMSQQYHENANASRDDLSVSSEQRRLSVTRREGSQPRATNNPTKRDTFAQLNDYLTVPHASPKTQKNRSGSSTTVRSKHSSDDTVTSYNTPNSRGKGPRFSARSNETVDSTTSTGSNQGQPGYGVQEAKAIAFTPLASTVEAASSVTVPQTLNDFDLRFSPQTGYRTSHNSRASDQPTPPLSPSSVEFYMQAPEPVRKDPAVSAAEAHNARLMAVTRQEEMLLAALRKKRARMRENIIAEMEEDRGSRGSTSSAGSGARNGSRSASAHARDTSVRSQLRDSRANSRSHDSANRSSSLMGRAMGHDHTQNRSGGGHNADRPPSTSQSDPVGTQSDSRARHERVLLYLDRPINGADPIDTAEPSPDLSEFMGEEEYMSERRSRSRSKFGSIYGNMNNYSQNPQRGPRKSPPDSSPISPRTSARPRLPLQDVPEAEAEFDEDIDADDIDFDDMDEVVNQRHLISHQSRPKEKDGARPDSPLSLMDAFLAPPTGTGINSKKSNVRLSAVGRVSSPMPFWGDDD